jgi:sec-independent protein translocase protein TatA
MASFSPIPVLFAIMGIGPMELAIICVVVLLLFGHRLPSVMRSLGSGIVEFKKGVKGAEDEDADAKLKNDAKG